MLLFCWYRLVFNRSFDKGASSIRPFLSFNSGDILPFTLTAFIVILNVILTVLINFLGICRLFINFNNGFNINIWSIVAPLFLNLLHTIPVCFQPSSFLLNQVDTTLLRYIYQGNFLIVYSLVHPLSCMFECCYSMHNISKEIKKICMEGIWSLDIINNDNNIEIIKKS